MLGVGAAALAQGSTLTLDEALKIAESSAFPVRLAQTDVERARQRLAESKGQLLPFVSAQARYTRFDKAITTSFDTTTIVIRPLDQKDLSLALSMPIDISGNLGRVVDASRYTLRASEASLAGAKRALRLEVRRAYFQTVQSKWQVGVAEEALNNAQERLKNAEAQLRAGAIARVDYLRFQTEVSQSEADLIAAKNANALAKNNLNNVLARPIETDFETAEITELPPEPGIADSLVGAAIKTRPEVESQRQQVNALRKLRESEERGLDPSLLFSLTHGGSLGVTGFGGSAGATTGALTLSIPIFDSGVTRARVRAARQDEEAAKIRLQQTELGLSLEVRQALRSFADARARLEVADKQVVYAEESYRLAVVKNQAGEGIPLEVIDAQTQLTQARTSQIAARYDILIAYSQLQAAVGSDDLGRMKDLK